MRHHLKLVVSMTFFKEMNGENGLTFSSDIKEINYILKYIKIENIDIHFNNIAQYYCF